MLIDFRSDTVTHPTPAMLEAMMKAPIGDDVYGEDPSVNQLEEMAAALFGMEAALFCPSGTMTNQIAIKCHKQPGDEVICDATTPKSFVDTLRDYNILGTVMSPTQVRLVTHLDISAKMVEQTVAAIENLEKQ